MSQSRFRYKFRQYIALALSVVWVAVMIFAPFGWNAIGRAMAVQRVGLPAFILATIALTIWRIPAGVSSLQMSDLRFYIASALSVVYVALLTYGPTSGPAGIVVQHWGQGAYILAMFALVFWPKFFDSRRHRF